MNAVRRRARSSWAAEVECATLGVSGQAALDVAVAGAGLAALTPALVVVGAAVRLDSPGPALFRQERLGAHGTRFRIFKFRTMRHGSAVEIDDQGQVQTLEQDGRHTRIGAWLRAYSLDEVPQLGQRPRGAR